VSLTAVVLAGGKGTRIASLAGPDRPKAMLSVAGRPFLDHKLQGLAEQGVREVVLLVGHGADHIRAHVADGSAWGLRVRCVEDGPTLLGTGGAVRAALAALPDAFWVTYGDTYLPIELEPVEAAFRATGRLALMTVLHNEDRVEPSNATIGSGLVIRYAKGEAGMTHIDYGMLAFHRSAFEPYPTGEAFDLGEVVRDLVARRELAAFEVTVPFHDIGTPSTLADTDAWFASVIDRHSSSGEAAL
jgi:NDP-sugar pyrophosphorylase family protein